MELYSQLEADIIANMAKRLKKLGKVTDSTLYQAQVFKEVGGLQADIFNELKKYDVKTQKELSLLFSEALNKSINGDFSRIKEAKLSPAQQQILNAIVKKSQSAGIVNGSKKVQKEAENGFIKVFSGVQRATMTIASSASNDFVNAANSAFMQTVTGATDYNTALIEGVDKLAKKGVHTVEYTDSGKILNRSVESMLRTNILTGVNQTATQITLDNCEELECNLVEVSAHLGARPEHEAWQGKIYSLTPGNPKYPYFNEACDYGSPTGICGINCRHSFYPYFPGQKPMYTKGELDEYKEANIDIGGGKMVTRYEAEQQQRGIERNIRKYKREVAGLEQIAPDAPETIAAKNKLYQWQQTARDFSTQTGLNRDYVRERIGTTDGKQPTGKKPKKENQL